jgi:hypothetical protein
MATLSLLSMISTNGEVYLIQPYMTPNHGKVYLIQPYHSCPWWGVLDTTFFCKIYQFFIFLWGVLDTTLYDSYPIPWWGVLDTTLYDSYPIPWWGVLDTTLYASYPIPLWSVLDAILYDSYQTHVKDLCYISSFNKPDWHDIYLK